MVNNNTGLSPNAALVQLLETRRESIEQIATAHLSADKLLKIVGVAVSRNPKILQCTPVSVMQCVMTCSELGLAPDPFGSVYLVPYGADCTLIVGYRGLLTLARRSGKVSMIYAEVVREGDVFEYEMGLEPQLRHKPSLAAGDRRAQYIYAVAKLTDGCSQFVVLTVADVERVRGRSRAARSGPWVTDWDEMAKKTAVRRLMKWLPMSVDDASALAAADSTEYDMRDVASPARRAEPGIADLRHQLLAAPDAAPDAAGQEDDDDLRDRVVYDDGTTAADQEGAR